MKPIIIGRFRLGLNWISLYADPGTANGSVIPLPDNKGQREIHVGIDPEWDEVLGTFLHELMEISFIDLNTRYKVKPSWSSESSDYSFFMTHNQFGEACERAGDFLKHALPSFTVVYGRYQKQKADKEKKAKRKVKK